MNHNARWLNERRIRAYPRIMVGLFMGIGMASIGYWWLYFPSQKLVVSDLTVFWIAAAFARAGHAAQAYTPGNIQTVMWQFAPDIQGRYGWFYPPPFYLLILPLGWLSFFWSYMLFMGSSLAGYSWAIRKIVHGREAMWILAAFPGIWMNFLTGQNGLLTATLAGMALLALQRRPIVSGALIGLLIIKPHLALLFPLALVALKAWRTLMMAAFTSLLLVLASIGVLGSDTMEAWRLSLGTARSILEAGGTAPMMPTVFSSLRLLGVSVGPAYGAHGLIALWAAAALWRVSRSKCDFTLKASALMVASLLMSPYLFEYDLAWLGFVIAWMAETGRREGWERGEREVLVIAWLLPLMTLVVAWYVRVQVGPWANLMLLWLIARRASNQGNGVVQT